MLPKGSIAKIYKYYFRNPRYSEEILRAMREFFDRPDLEPGGSLEMNDKSEGLFNEWFLYDFVLSNGEHPCGALLKKTHWRFPRQKWNFTRTSSKLICMVFMK